MHDRRGAGHEECMTGGVRRTLGMHDRMDAGHEKLTTGWDGGHEECMTGGMEGIWNA